MALGMGTVFAFLTILIIVVNIMSYIVNRFFPEPQASNETSSGGASKTDNKKVIAAITAAITHHRKG